MQLKLLQNPLYQHTQEPFPLWCQTQILIVQKWTQMESCISIGLVIATLFKTDKTKVFQTGIIVCYAESKKLIDKYFVS